MKILLAIDGSASAARATELVGSVAWPPGSTIRVLSVVQPLMAGSLSMPGTVAAPDGLDHIAGAARAEAKRVAAAAAARLRAPDRSATEWVADGRPATVIVEMVKDFMPDLVVLGNRGRGGIASTALGSVSSEVVEHSPVSVLVARTPTISRIVLADDGSADAAVARRLVEVMPGFHGMPVRIVTVEERTSAWYGWLQPVSPGTAQEFEDSIAGDRKRYSALASSDAEALTTLGHKAERDVRVGDPGSEIVAAAKEDGADLIVMGTRGQTGLTRMLMGSVARKVLQHAACSILVVRSPAAHGGHPQP